MKQKVIFYKYAYGPEQDRYIDEDSWYETFAVVDNDVKVKDFLKEMLGNFPHVKIIKPNIQLLENVIFDNKKDIAKIVEKNIFLSEQIKILSGA